MLAPSRKGATMLNRLTPTQKLAVYGFTAGILTVAIFLLLFR